MKHLNVIINPVNRWFHYEKAAPLEIYGDPIPLFLKDREGNDVVCFLGLVDYHL